MTEMTEQGYELVEMGCEENKEEWSQQEVIDAIDMALKCHKAIGGKREHTQEMFNMTRRLDIWEGGKFLHNPLQERMEVYKGRYKTPLKDGKILGLFLVQSKEWLIKTRIMVEMSQGGKFGISPARLAGGFGK